MNFDKEGSKFEKKKMFVCVCVGEWWGSGWGEVGEWWGGGGAH